MMVFAIHQYESAIGIHVSPPPWSPLPPPSPPHPSRLSQSTGFGCPGSHIKPALLSISHVVMYVFQYYPLKSCYPLLLLLSAKVSSLCPCVFCCPAHDTSCHTGKPKAFSTCQLKSISITTFDIWCSWKPELSPPLLAGFYSCYGGNKLVPER